MKIAIKAMIVTKATFKFEEISHLTLESEQMDFMEEKLREELKSKKHEHNGGECNWDFDWIDGVVTVTLAI